VVLLTTLRFLCTTGFVYAKYNFSVEFDYALPEEGWRIDVSGATIIYRDSEDIIPAAERYFLKVIPCLNESIEPNNLESEQAVSLEVAVANLFWELLLNKSYQNN